VPHKIHQIGRVLAVVNGESRIEADLARVLAQEPRANPVEGPGPKRIGHDTCAVANHPARDPLDTPRHLGGGPAREGHQQDFAGSAPLTMKWATGAPGCWSCRIPPGNDKERRAGGRIVLRTPCSTARRCSGLSFSR